MWNGLTITMKKPDSQPTDTLSGQAQGSRDLDVPLKGSIPTGPLDLVWRVSQCESTSCPVLGVAPPESFQFHLGILFVLFVVSTPSPVQGAPVSSMGIDQRTTWNSWYN